MLPPPLPRFSFLLLPEEVGLRAEFDERRGRGEDRKCGDPPLTLLVNPSKPRHEPLLLPKDFVLRSILTLEEVVLASALFDSDLLAFDFGFGLKLFSIKSC